MGAAGHAVHALRAKFIAMAEALAAREFITRPSLKCLADLVGVAPRTITSAATNGTATVELQKILKERAWLDPDAVEWIDLDVDPQTRSRPARDGYPGRDTALRFRAYYFRKLGLVSIGFRRFARVAPTLSDMQTASFALTDFGQATHPGEPLRLYFTAVIEPGIHESGIRYGFNRVRLTILQGTKSLAFVNRLGNLEINGALLTVRSTEYNPEWFLSVAAGALDDEFTTAKPLCEIESAEIGDSFVAELAVRQHDGFLFLDAKAPELSANKAAVIKELFAETLPEHRRLPGWRVLGTQKLTVVRADNL